jgi:hypothetical protein
MLSISGSIMLHFLRLVIETATQKRKMCTTITVVALNATTLRRLIFKVEPEGSVFVIVVPN